jgi:hypothetical protein
METLHFSLLLLKGWTPDPAVFAAVPMMGFKIMVMTALSLLCSLTFTSAPTASVFSILLWVLGHFGEEIERPGYFGFAGVWIGCSPSWRWVRPLLYLGLSRAEFGALC